MLVVMERSTNHIVFALFSITMLSYCLSTGSDTICIQTEKQALLKLKDDLVDPWNRLSSWTGEECCLWAGIICNNITGHVTKIRLGYYGSDYLYQLGGNINPSLTDLKDLRHLDLSRNGFKGKDIPSFIGSITTLRYLNLSDAGFGGKIPKQLGNLSRIRHLDLSNNFLYSLSVDDMQWLSGLRLLRHLDLSSVNLGLAIDWIQVTSMLPSLLELQLSSCNLVDVTPSLANINITSLSLLDLSYNSFSSEILHWVASLNRLVSLDVSYCFLGLFPSALRNMTSLRVYRNRGNRDPVTKISKWFYNLTALEDIALSDNLLQGVLPNEIGNYTSLVSLDLAWNQLEGKIPSSLGKLCYLKRIRLSHNNFARMEFEEFLGIFSKCKIKRLEVIELISNNIIGHLPENLATFKNLVYLSIRNNSISGPIPKSVGKLSHLIHLELSYNQLNETLPESIGQLEILETLLVSENLLQGTITDLHFSKLKRLTHMQASGNKLKWRTKDGWIPPFQVSVLALKSWQLGPKFPFWLQFQKKLHTVDISNTGISDSIPIQFWDALSNVYYLNLSSNQMYGEIPNIQGGIGSFWSITDLSSNRFICPLPHDTFSHVSWLDLSNNSLSGPIDHFLCRVKGEKRDTEVEILNLGNNFLSGEIPECWERWPYLMSIILEHNNLNGSMPNSLGNLTQLVSLHLRDNKLSGELPVTLRFCTQLSVLDLSSNQFGGNIPRWLGTSTSGMLVLILRSNRLTGFVPDELCHLQSLQILDLAVNNLSGPIPKCFSNLAAMKDSKKLFSTQLMFIHYGEELESGGVEFDDIGDLVTQGKNFEYKSILLLVKIVDFSSNSLSGEIPEGLTTLAGLMWLNLSRNHLTGSIPPKIGNMQSLERLDISFNNISGEIPSGMATLNFLSYLNLSHNKLTGLIPSSTQLQGLDESSFLGNSLCGPPLPSCRSAKVVPHIEHKDAEEDEDGRIWFYGSMGFGFVVSFTAILVPFLFIASWRRTCFLMLDIMLDSLSNYLFRL